MNVPSPASWRELLGSAHALSTVVVLVGILAPAVNAFITATMLPSVIADIGGLSLYAWASTAYAVTSILGSAGFSVVTRALGPRAGLVTAAAVFVTGTGSCAAAPSMAVLVAGRAIQGLGGGMMVASVYGIVRELFPERLWPRVFATISGAWGIAALGGPAVGGLFAGRGLWRAGFWALVPAVVLAAAISWRILRRTARPRRRQARVPLGRLGLVCAAVLAVASVANTRSPALQAMLVTGALAAIGLMLRIDGRARVRLFPSDMLAFGRPLGKAFAIQFLLALGTSPIGVFIALLLQVIHGLPPAVAGYIHAGQSIAWTTATVLGARLQGQQVRAAIVIGPLVVSAGFAGLASTIATGPVAAIAASVILVGVGIGTCWAHLSNVVLAGARPDEEAATASLVPSAQQFAIAFGAALSGIVASATGLSGAAAAPVAALTGTALYGSFIAAPLAAAIIATRLRPAAPLEVIVTTTAR